MRVLALALVAIAIVSGNEAKKICEPGALSIKDCNECICSKDGTAEVCTLMSCELESSIDLRVRRDLTEENVQTVEASLQKKKICEPGVSSKVDCNNCICSKDGTFQACTLMLCLSLDLSDPTVHQEIPENVGQTGKNSSESFELVSNNPVLRKKRQVSHNRPCEAGKRFKIYCNDCTCGSDGFSVACTRMGCPKGVYNEDGSLKNREEVPNNPLLRQKRQVSDNRPCEPGKRFKIYCNDCTCGSDGFSVACTRMACPKGVYNEDGSLKNREEVPNNPLLRQKRQVSDNRPCEAGKRFKIYCNDCTCGSDGFSVACTRMACPKGVYNEDGSLKNREEVPNNPLLRQKRQVSDNRPCEAGKRFKIYCNDCTCGSDGFSVACTRMACPKGVYNEDGSLKNREEVPNNPLLRQKRQVSHNRPCEAGKRFKIYCNDCTCGSDGFSVVCTRMACPEGVYNEDGSLKNREEVPNNPLLRQKRQVSHNRPCEAGKRFKIYCNDCTCGSDGFSVVCTRMACPEGVYNEDGSLKNPEQVSDTQVLRQKRQISEDVHCEPGKSFKMYCNTCSCGSNGRVAACTYMYCPDGLYNFDGSLKNPEQVPNTPVLRQKRQVHGDVHCEPGKSFKMYCNLCSCASNGRLAACTVKACPEGVYNFDGSLKNSEQVSNTPVLRQKRQINEDVHCEPGKMFKMYCNTCSCGSDGRTAACTLMACPEGVYNFDGSLKNPDQISNTLVLRQKRLINEDVHCEPGKIFKMYCNTCDCGSDGRLGICTAMACPEGLYNFDGSLKNPDQVSKTPVLRQKRQISEDVHCEPGKMFKMYCNTCSCGSDGRTAACTAMACPEGVYNFDGSLKNPDQVSNTPVLRQKRQISEDVHCEPGKMFKMYCNTCSCGSDGRMAACTLMACPEGVYNFDGSLKNPDQVSNTPVLRQKRQISEDVHCEPGKTFKMFCNTCGCGSDGRLEACTEIACPEGVYNFDGSLKNPEQVSNTPVLRQKRQISEDIHCEPGKSFKMYCNTCSCGTNGRLAACTYMHCPEGMYNFDGSLKSATTKTIA